MKQPLGIVAVLYAAGLLLGDYFPIPLVYLFAISFTLAFAALALPRLRLAFLYPLVIFASWTNFVCHTAIISPSDLRVLLKNEPALATVRGTLIETPAVRESIDIVFGPSFHTVARINVSAIQQHDSWQTASGTVFVFTTSTLSEPFYKGQQVEVHGVIQPPDGPLAEGLFDFAQFLRRQEIYFELKAKDPDWKAFGHPVSQPLSDRFMAWADHALTLGRTNVDDTTHLQQILTLGDKTYLTDTLTEPFVQAATFHIFAVDGLRMAILFGMFFGLLRILRVPRLVSGVVLIPLIWSYVMLTGWPASAIRAAVMLTIVIVGWSLKRPVDVLNSLFAAALIILLWQPQQLFQAGFQLSFVVVFCILMVMPVCDNFVQRLLAFDPLLPDDLRPRWQRLSYLPARFILDLICTSLAAWLGSIPLAAYYFHIFTPVSTPANVVAVFLCPFLLAINILALIFAGWFPAVTVSLNWLGWHLMETIRVTSIWFAHLPHAYCYVSAPNIFSIAVYYAIFLAVITGWLFKRKWLTWRITSVVLLSAIWCGQWIYHESEARITAIPLEGGSIVYCDMPGAKDDLLVDCGGLQAAYSLTVPYLHAQGVNFLSRLALTHGDAEQVDGFQYLQQVVDIRKIVTSPVEFRSSGYREIMKLVGKTPARHDVVREGEHLGNWTVLNPTGTNQFTHADDNTLVLQESIMGTRLLLLSDLGIPGQEALLERYHGLRSDIVITGLPEKGEPLKDALLEAINPQLIILADSEKPAERRASRVLRQRLESHGVRVLYTSEIGAVKISLRQNRWQATSPEGVVLASGPNSERKNSASADTKNSAP